MNRSQSVTDMTVSFSPWLGLVKFALDNGQPIDSMLNGVFAIHAACCSNANVAVVLYLIERGADVNAKRLPRKYSNEKGVQTVGTTGSTPLHFAAANGCLAVVDILLRHGAIVDMTDKYGSSPLSVAAARNHPEVASLLRQYSAMQRGVQDLTPDNESKDPFVDRRGSLELRGTAPSSRITAAVAAAAAGHQKDTSAQSLPVPSGRSTQTTRSPGQRRISLPSIIESPSSPSPNILPPPRQSCDLGRPPQSTEPLVRSTAFIRSTPSQPTRNITMAPSRPEDRPVKSPTRDQSDSSLNKSKEPDTRTIRRSQTVHDAQNSLLTPTEATPMKRRKSMESAALLSPQSALCVNRRKSFDHLSSLRHSNSKSRRSSDASTASEGTASSGTSGTSHTSVSDNAAESSQDRNRSSNNGNMARPKLSGSSQGSHPHLIRSTSQPLIDLIKPRRTPVSFVLEPPARQSLDLQRLASNQDRTADKDRNGEPRNDSDSDLPGLLFRRRTMQEASNSKLGTVPRYHSMGPMVDSSNAEGGSSRNQHHLHHSTTGSSTSLQEMSAPRLSTSSISSNHSGSGSFSGSATVSGRISRMWSSSASNGKDLLKDGSVNNGGAGEFGELGDDTAANRSRSSMLNRLSGIWGRR
ncbi:hypothetical protein BGZ54_002816 [Gamsiella multidivaricata]|nr:hypothetical protein BGZ54_002816 [Gamsiella multidivaricata]